MIAWTVVLADERNTNFSYDLGARSREIAVQRARTRHYQATGDTFARLVAAMATLDPALDSISRKADNV